ncbi:hypothetical protein ABZV91_28440 [Nocardia sp. NPDC004568]|uniref:hypothetical protein n=1 Tax=Nocardia sp. NPDC004568 TaxID=3154551 RepID=UPI0033B1B695
MTRLLILGGSWFLGREIAGRAVAQGREVTTFRRGRTGTDVEGVASVRGDRTHPDDGDPGPSTHGFGKAGCERAVAETFGPGRTTILRPGVILGRHRSAA